MQFLIPQRLNKLLPLPHQISPKKPRWKLLVLARHLDSRIVGETDKQQQQKGGQQTKERRRRERRRRERRRRVSLCLSISFFLLARGQAVGRAHSPALTIKLRPTSSMSSELQYDDRSRRAGFWPDYPHPRRRNEYPHNITPALHCPCTCTARPAPCDR